MYLEIVMHLSDVSITCAGSVIPDVKFAELRSIIQFMYKGEVEVDQTDIESLIGTAEGLMIRGESRQSQSHVGVLRWHVPRRV